MFAVFNASGNQKKVSTVFFYLCKLLASDPWTKAWEPLSLLYLLQHYHLFIWEDNILLKVAKIVTLLSNSQWKGCYRCYKNGDFPSLAWLCALLCALALRLLWQWFPHGAHTSHSRFSSTFSRLCIQGRPTAVTMVLKNPAKGLRLQEKFNQFNCLSAHFGRESRIIPPAHSVKDAMKSALSEESRVWEAASPPCCAKCLCRMKGNVKYWCLMGLKLLSWCLNEVMLFFPLSTSLLLL